MIILEISDNWYFFLVFAGGIAIIATIVLLFERRSESEEILKLNPWSVLRNILLIQISFYLLYLLIAFTISVASFEVFRVSQVFASIEFTFFSTRGLITALSLTVSMASLAVPLAAIVPNYKFMIDYCFTAFVIHFIVVSIVQNDFPVSGSWWLAIAVGLILMTLLSERLSYGLFTMSYQSSLGGRKTKTSKTQSQVAEEHNIEDEDKETELPEIRGSDTDAKTSEDDTTTKKTEPVNLDNEKLQDQETPPKPLSLKEDDSLFDGQQSVDIDNSSTRNLLRVDTESEIKTVSLDSTLTSTSVFVDVNSTQTVVN